MAKQLIVFGFFLFSFLSQAQVNKKAPFSDKEWGIELRPKYGFLIAHRSIMSHIPEQLTKALECTFFYRTNGEKSWQKAFKRPVVGFSVLLSTSGNKELMGLQSGVFTFLQYPFLSGEHSKIFGKVGCGVGFSQKVFDQELNPKSIALSSHVNALINFGLFYQYQFQRNHVSFGLDMTHFSNGASKMPNLGVNLPFVTVGFGHRIREGKPIDKQFSPFDRNWNFLAVGIVTFRDAYPTGEHKYPVLALQLAGQRKFTHGVGYETGVDLIYKPSNQSYKPVMHKSTESLFQMGWYHAYAMTLDRMQILVGMGVYVRDVYNADDQFYHRVGMRYTVNKQLILNLTLKSHWAKADYIEYGIAYRL